jgi:hypothetical protein
MSPLGLSLFLRGEEAAPVETSGIFSADEAALLKVFVELVGRIRDSTLLRRGMPGMSGLKFDMQTGLTFTSSEYTDAELYELLHVLRPVILEDERASFRRIAALLGRALPNPDVRAYLKTQNRVFRHGEMNLYMQISVENQPLFDESLLRTWLNGTQYHTDTQKAEAWNRLMSVLKESNGRALVMSQLRGKVVALFNVDYIARQVVAAANDA